jgi:hypothetical protein
MKGFWLQEKPPANQKKHPTLRKTQKIPYFFMPRWPVCMCNYDPEWDPNPDPGVINHSKNNVKITIIGWLDAL